MDAEAGPVIPWLRWFVSTALLIFASMVGMLVSQMKGFERVSSALAACLVCVIALAIAGSIGTAWPRRVVSISGAALGVAGVLLLLGRLEALGALVFVAPGYIYLPVAAAHSDS